MMEQLLNSFYAVVWCDSPRGLISYYTYPEDSLPLAFFEIPSDTVKVEDKEELFAILVRRDGTKVTFPYYLLDEYLGWTD